MTGQAADAEDCNRWGNLGCVSTTKNANQHGRAVFQLQRRRRAATSSLRLSLIAWRGRLAGGEGLSEF